MIVTSLILGAVAIAGTGILAKFWNNIIDFLQKVIRKLQEKMVVSGCKDFLKKLGDKFQNISKNYSQNEAGKWKETVVTYEMDEKEVPPEYREKASRLEKT